jgi:hypothetical protein
VAVTVTVVGDGAAGPEHPAKGISRAINNKSETVILMVYKILVTVFARVNHPIVMSVELWLESRAIRLGL